MPSDYIKLQGNWKLTAYEGYLDHSLRYNLEAVKDEPGYHSLTSLFSLSRLGGYRAVVWAIKTERTPKRVVVYLFSP